MSRWKGLPASLDHRVRHLVVHLRRLKDHSGLSLTALAARTSYSKSSWERYLNGKKLPPRAAVEALARVCDADAPRLLALQEVAAQAWHATRPAPAAGQPVPRPAGRAARDETAAPAGLAASAAPTAAAGPPSGRLMPLPPLVLGALAALVMAGAALLVVRLWQDATGIERAAVAAPAAGVPGAAPTFTHRPGEAFGCSVRRRAGALYAGHSRTDTAVLGSGAAGWDVVEAQCLLHRRGCDPGVVDGIVGGRTRRAVQRLQARSGLPTDGIVGPDTWKALRR
ncbi:peptidoglycan-binding protein [Streptomyces caniferus]|uniref:helix-turn-helix domain-containing protein n=1 Tax=Streptomyces caniferus TaxID=285557 RepID=UPI00135BF67E|nr:helix-turn-helix domain-containing protein [Streptomyces caniferus]